MSSVDVVVPCYNYGRYLNGCVESVLSQRDVDVRVLINDDSSSDDTAAVGAALAAADQRVTFRRHEVNLGHIKTFNEGVLDWARAPYTLLISADDALTAGSLARSVHVLDAHPEAGMVYGIAHIFKLDSDKTDIADTTEPTYQIISGPKFLQQTCERGILASSPSVVVRTGLQQRLGGYRAHLPHSCDMEMWMRFATQGSVGVIREVQAYYREHGENMNLQYCNRTLGDSRQQIEASREIYNHWCPDLPAFDAWMNRQRRRLCDDAYWHAGQALEDGDEQGAAMCLAFAREYDVALVPSRAWLKFHAKALLGRHRWNNITPWVRRIRGRDGSKNVGLKKEFGWWPDIACSREI
jgi:glycosyltransferase involved in cell wall biosynthesis